MTRLCMLTSLLLALAGCGNEIATDGSPEARQVAAWLSSSRWSLWQTDDPVEPGATLVMSDYGMPLTLSNLRRFGPDRMAGCSLSRVARSRFGVTATWLCSAPVALPQRQVEFGMRDGRIRDARHIEGVMATLP